MLAERANEAGIMEFSPQDLRRPFISDLLAAGADFGTVAKLAGHQNIETTARYDRGPDDAKQKAAELQMPYGQRESKSQFVDLLSYHFH